MEPQSRSRNPHAREGGCVSGVLCLEGDWYGVEEDSTVKPLLELLRYGIPRRLPMLHRAIATREELAFHLRRWRRARRYRLLFLGFHGDPGVVYLDSKQRQVVTLDDLAVMIGRGHSGRLVHFSACSTLAVDRRHINRFVRRTGVLGVTGFAADVDWLRSAAFELLILSKLLRFSPSLRGVRRAERALMKEAPALRRELAFRFVTR